jgi:hypothetical protein
MVEDLRRVIYRQHDVVCNQKYGDGLPYSFHLKAVEAQGEKFIKLIIEGDIYIFSKGVSFKDIVRLSLTGHDLQEDGRMSYKDIKGLASKLGNSFAGEMVSDIIYCVTDEKGKNRQERKSEKYYAELKQNSLAVFVKLADISANTLYSKLTDSSMYRKYKSEFPKFKEICYVEDYSEFFEYVESL